jgi:predicted short-subunit dehydrogenase-like oxidoreductase (DUF2520 family)
LTKDYIAIIGAGKLAYSLTPALIKSGFKVEIVISKNPVSAKTLAKKYSISHFSDSVNKIPKYVNVFFITAPDGEIKKVADKISKLKRKFENCICVHFSGLENIHSLNPLKKRGCAIGSIHIIQPFPSKNVVEIKNSPAAIEADDKLSLKFLYQLAKKLKLKSHQINSEEKVMHHLAAVHSSNFLVGNLYNAFSLISSKNNFAKDSLKQTTQSALNNVYKLSPSKALSGPVDRGDLYTIKKHFEALDNKIKKSGGIKT